MAKLYSVTHANKTPKLLRIVQASKYKRYFRLSLGLNILLIILNIYLLLK